MENAIIIGILVLIVGGISFYLFRSKRRGGGCVGCPCAGNCTKGSCPSSGKGEK